VVWGRLVSAPGCSLFVVSRERSEERASQKLGRENSPTNVVLEATACDKRPAIAPELNAVKRQTHIPGLRQTGLPLPSHSVYHEFLTVCGPKLIHHQHRHSHIAIPE